MLLLNPITGAQMVLIGLGVIFQFVAFTAMRKDEVSERPSKAGPKDEPQPTTPEPQFTRQQTRRLVSLPAQSARSKGYYEMEKVEPNVRPADLLRTAKVKYVDDVKLPRA